MAGFTYISGLVWSDFKYTNILVLLVVRGFKINFPPLFRAFNRKYSHVCFIDDVLFNHKTTVKILLIIYFFCKFLLGCFVSKYWFRIRPTNETRLPLPSCLPHPSPQPHWLFIMRTGDWGFGGMSWHLRSFLTTPPRPPDRNGWTRWMNATLRMFSRSFSVRRSNVDTRRHVKRGVRRSDGRKPGMGFQSDEPLWSIVFGDFRRHYPHFRCFHFSISAEFKFLYLYFILLIC